MILVITNLVRIDDRSLVSFPGLQDNNKPMQFRKFAQMVGEGRK